MLNSTFRWIARGCIAGVLLVLFGCSSSKPYTLVAQFPSTSKQLIMMAAIDVEGSACTVTAMTWSVNKPWTPSCTVNSDQPTHKSFTIDGQQVDLDADAGGFKLSNTPPLTVPFPASSAAPAPTAKVAATTAVEAKAKGKTKAGVSKMIAKATGNTTSAAPVAASTAAAATTVSGAAFPAQWKVTLFPGHQRIVAQNLGYLVKSAEIDVDGSACKLDVVFKVRYPPYHLDCMASTNKRGDYHLLFNPYIVAKVASSATNTILMVSEGASISGVIWDSHGFDGWTPSVPPSWRLRTKSDN